MTFEEAKAKITFPEFIVPERSFGFPVGFTDPMDQADYYYLLEEIRKTVTPESTDETITLKKVMTVTIDIALEMCGLSTDYDEMWDDNTLYNVPLGTKFTDNQEGTVYYMPVI